MSVDAATAAPRERYGLFPSEIYWRDHFDWLKECGYELRPRFRPGWIPSWKADPRKIGALCEDSWTPLGFATIDAVRLRDNAKVQLKKVEKDLHPYEVEIGKFLTDLGPSPANHCVPILEILQPPDDSNLTIIVMPLLRRYDSPKFDTFGEAVEFFRQIFEGLQFMHHHNVAHRDGSFFNIMMDGQNLYPHGFHPDIGHQNFKPNKVSKASHYTRTRLPVKYYFIDFGLSRRYDAAQREGPLLEYIIHGADKSPPEHNIPHQITADPFPTDIYYLGNTIREDFFTGNKIFTFGLRGFEFMEPLVKDMVQDDPTKRPKIDEVVTRFAEIQKSLSPWKLRSRVIGKRELPYLPHRVVAHWYRRIRSIVLRVPAIPVPSN